MVAESQKQYSTLKNASDYLSDEDLWNLGYHKCNERNLWPSGRTRDEALQCNGHITGMK